MTNLIKQNFQVACIAIALFLVSAVAADAAALRITPDTGVYQVGNTFTARVQIATQGQSVNAAEGTIKFNPNELSVVSVLEVDQSLIYG